MSTNTGAARKPRQRKPASAPGTTGGKAAKVDEHPLAAEVTAYFLAGRFHSPGGAFPSKTRQPTLNLITEAATAYAGFVSGRTDFAQTDEELIAKVSTLNNLSNTH